LRAYGHTPKPTANPFQGFPALPLRASLCWSARAVSGVYAKVMNFRSIDPRAAGEGMSGAGETDRKVWNEFFDSTSSTLRTDALVRSAPLPVRRERGRVSQPLTPRAVYVSDATYIRAYVFDNYRKRNEQRCSSTNRASFDIGGRYLILSPIDRRSRKSWVSRRSCQRLGGLFCRSR
jgi:hypothetical protein